jgi:hypothetical protein
MKTYRWLTRRKGIFGAVLLVAVLGCNAAAAASPASCDMSLTVELWPDVPDPGDAGFLSSLLGNHPSYRLTLREQRSSTLVVLDLTGPGRGERCENVIEAMRKDARVLSVHAQPVDAQPANPADSDVAVAVVASPLHSEERSDTHLSATGSSPCIGPSNTRWTRGEFCFLSTWETRPVHLQTSGKTVFAKFTKGDV